MFGLEGGKKKKKSKEGFVFELEKEFKDAKTGPELRIKLQERIQEIQEILRKGDERDEIEKLSKILLGYVGVMKVMIRCVAPKKT